MKIISIEKNIVCEAYSTIPITCVWPKKKTFNHKMSNRARKKEKIYIYFKIDIC